MKKSVIIFGLTCFLATSLLADKFESIDKMIITAKGLEVQVLSSGCTEKEHFSVQRDDESEQIRFIRNVPDRCKMVHHPIWIHFDFSELKLNDGEGFTLHDTLITGTDRKSHHRNLPTRFSCNGEGYEILADLDHRIQITHYRSTYTISADKFRIIRKSGAISIEMTQHLSYGILNMALQIPANASSLQTFEGDFSTKVISPFVGATIENDPNLAPPSHKKVVCYLEPNDDL